MDEDRLNHTLAVARKMKDIANEYKLSKDDIGYEFSNREKIIIKLARKYQRLVVLNFGKKYIIMEK